MTEPYDARIKLRHLQAFAAVARERTVQRAADALSLTASAVSKALTELEAVVQRPLFRRTRKGLLATAEGEQLLRHVLPGLGLLRDGLALAAGQPQSTGVLRVRVGVLPTTASTVVPLAVEQLQRGQARFEIQVVSGTNLHLLDLLRESELDMVVGRLPAPALMFGLSFEPLYTEPMVLVTVPSHPLVGRADVVAADLLPYPVILPQQGTIIRSAVDSFLLSSGISSLPRVLETVADSFANALVQASHTVWFAPLGLVRREITEHKLVRLPFDTRVTVAAVGLSVRAGTELHTDAHAMMDAIRAQAARWRDSE